MPANAKNASVSVIVPAFNAADRIARCLDALNNQTTRPDEIIVVDNGSEDATADIATAHGATVVCLYPNAGPAAARNRGAEAATGDLLLFTDDDCAPTSTWVTELTAPFEDADVVGAKGTYCTTQRAVVARWVQLEYSERYERMALREQIDFIDTYSAAYRREVFLDAEGFDESFRAVAVEDQEFSFRLAERGLKMVFAPRAVVEHEHPATLREYFRRKYLIGMWKWKVLERYPSKAVDDAHTPQTLKLQVLLAGSMTALAPISLFSRSAAKAGAFLAGAFALSGLPTMRFAATRDPGLSPAIPLLLSVRALGLGFGLLRGLALRRTG